MFYGKTKNEVRSSVFAKAKEVLGLLSFKTGGRVRTLLEVLAELLYSLKTEDMEGLIQQVDYTKAKGDALRQLALAYGITPRDASKALGFVRATANKAGKLAAGAWLVWEGNPEIRYKVLEDSSYSVTGAFGIKLEAEFSGSRYNLIAGAQLRFSSVNLDLQLAPLPESFPETGGREAESDAMLRRRIAARFDASFAIDLQKSRYQDVIYQNFPSVEEAKVVRVPRGAGTVDIYIKVVGGLPSVALLADIKERLGAFNLIARDLQLLAPELVPIVFSVKVSEPSLSDAVRQKLLAYADSLGIGEALREQDLYAAVAGYEGVEILEPSGNVVVADSQLISLSAVRVF